MDFKLKKILLLVQIFCGCVLTHAQLNAQSNPYRDSLFQLLKTTQEDTIKFEVNIELAYEYIRNSFDKSLAFAKKVLDISKKLENTSYEAECLDVIGSIYSYQGDYPKAVSYKIESLKLYEKENNDYGEALLSNNLGVLYFRQKNFDKALFFYQKALKKAKDLQNEEMISTYLLNIGEIFYEKKQYKKAQEHELEAYNIARKLKILDTQAYALGILGKIYATQGLYTKAIETEKKAIQAFQKLNDMGAEIEYSLTLANIFKEQNRVDSAMVYAQKSLQIAQTIGARDWQKESYFVLSEVYAQKNVIDSAYHYHQLYAILKDSIFNENSSKQVSQLQTLYETEKKEQENQLLKKDTVLQQEIIDRQRVMNIAVIIGLLLLIVLAVVLYRSNRIKKHNNEQLTLKNTEINQQKEEILTQRDAIEEQRNEIEEKQRNIEASINYASRIQKALLPFQHEIKKYLPNHFILFRPRDIVSGDFYWFAQQNGKIILAAIDCTGHGVPGAFMSMIADSLLTQIVVDNNVFDVSEILIKMHKGIRKSLKQSQTGNGDGMDLAMCMIDKENRVLEYAGAHNPLIIIQHEELQKIKGTRLGIGGFSTGKVRHYAKHQFSLETSTSFYIYSDGYQDQFGGASRKKFLPRNFEALLKKINHLPMEEQGHILDKEFVAWKGDGFQTDDVLVIGVKIE